MYCGGDGCIGDCGYAEGLEPGRRCWWVTVPCIFDIGLEAGTVDGVVLTSLRQR